MPRATVVASECERKELKSCPEGYVELRRMTYGQKLARQQMAVKMSMRMQKGNSKSGEMDMDMLQHASTIFDFQACIVGHNLEDETGRLLNLTQQMDIDRLDPRIGEEISKCIDEMNNFEDELEESNFDTGPAQAS